MRPDPEFVFSIAVIGGIVAIGLLVSIGLGMMLVGIYRKKKETKLTIHGKEKQNGQAKGGSHGRW